MRIRRGVAMIVAMLGITLVGVRVFALDVPAAPSLDTPIVDQTQTLTSSQITSLAQQIATSRAQKSYQIGILIIPTLGSGEYLEGYSLKVARGWGIGDKTDNGILVLVVMNDHKMRIEVGRGLEGDMTDTRAGRIIRDVMTPQFKAGNYYGGLSAAVDSIQRAVSKQSDPKLSTQSSASSQSTGGVVEGALWLLFFAGSGLSWLASMLARSKSWWGGGVVGGVIGLVVMIIFMWVFWAIILTVGLVILGLLLDFSVSRNYQVHKVNGTLPSWWAGGSSWTGGGGGFSGGGGFGGGGFSGGGASGSW